MIDAGLISEAVSRASDATARRMTSRVRRDAVAAGWPTSVSRHLSVRHESGAFRVVFPERLSESVDRLEHGDLSSDPRPVIRPFSNRLSSFDDRFARELDRHLGGML